MTAKTEPAPPPRQVTLRDGRALSWYEYGDPTGNPCLFFPGTATSGLAGAALDGPATAAGIRLISPDRPGLGHSDVAPERPLADWANDVEELVDQLSLRRFSVLGHSAGGAYALAVTRALTDRVSLTVICAGSGPYSENWFRSEGTISRKTRLYNGLALRAPRLFGALHVAGTPRSPKAISRLMVMIARGASPDAQYTKAHPAQTRASLEALADGCRQGGRGPTNDVRSLCQPWGFDLRDVEAPVQWWHGERDTNVSPASGRAVAARLPHATTRFVDAGHYALFAYADEVMASLTQAALRPTKPDAHGDGPPGLS